MNSFEAADIGDAAEMKARRMFWGSLLLSLLIVVHTAYQAFASGSGWSRIGMLLPAVLLWSMVVTCYAFHVLYTVAQHRAGQIADPRMDPNTGVFAVDYILSRLLLERGKALENGVPSMVAYVDLVNLEKVNREFGYTVGNIVLRALAQVVADNVRRWDVVGRVGGDEFVIVMPDTSREAAEAVVANLRESIKIYALDLGPRGKVDFVSCKVGLAAFPGEGYEPEEIVATARDRIL
jgi:diguanylate cyclase (GGDEF)-like protein